MRDDGLLVAEGLPEELRQGARVREVTEDGVLPVQRVPYLAQDRPLPRRHAGSGHAAPREEGLARALLEEESGMVRGA